MAGFYGVFSKQNIASNVYKYFSNNGLENTVQEEIKNENYIVGRSVLNKLPKDKIFFENEAFFVCTDGVIFDEKFSEAQDFIKEYKAKGKNAFQYIDGNISGLFFDKTNQKLIVFNDHLATRSIFYFYDKNFGFIVSSELQVLTQILKQNKLNYTLDTSAAYCLMVYGHLLEDNTLVKEVKRLAYSSTIEFDLKTENLSVEKYFKYEIKEVKIELQDAINEVERLFARSVKKDWNKDTENQAEHLSLLSGGMDAKTNVLMAKEFGYKEISTYTFGQSTSQDVIIAQDVATRNKFKHRCNFLDKADYLNIDNYEQYVKNTDGLVLLQGSAHMQFSMAKLDLKPYAVLHTGQIGDALFGSFSSQKSLSENKRNIGYVGQVFDPKMLDNIENLDTILQRNNGKQELFVYEQRIMNAAIMGDRALYNSIDSVSPFYDFELIKFMQSVPQEFKKDDKLYFDWLAQKHPQILDFKWEKIDMKPNHPLKVKYGKVFKRYVNGARKYFNFNYDSMNPFSKWLVENPEIVSNLKERFYKELENLSLDKKLKEDMITVFENDVFEYRNKFSVYTLVLAIKLHF